MTGSQVYNSLRKHMADIDGDAPLGGHGQIVEIDETFVGGQAVGRANSFKNKTVVIGMLERDGKVLTKVVPNNRKTSLLPAVVANVAPGSVIHTDELRSYADLHKHGFEHHKVNHSRGRYVGPTGGHVQGIENFWGQLKRAINGTHIHVSGKHLWKYAKEAEYRFNRRYRPETMLDELLGTFPTP